MIQKIGFLIFALCVLVADQISKWFVMEGVIVPALNIPDREALSLAEWYQTSLERLPYTELPVLPFFNWVMVWNHGISFGLFNEHTNYGPMILILLALVITTWFVIWLFMTKSKLQSAAIAMVIGGALGNAIDRFRFEAVIDFLDFHAFGYHWPAFNIGDSAIVIGVVVLMLCSFRHDTKPAAIPATENPQQEQ